MGNRRHRKRGPAYDKARRTGLTAREALEMAETMSHGEGAQLAIAAELMGVDYDEFVAELARPERAG